MVKKYNMAILGAGNIANSMAKAMQGLSDRIVCYAVASRSLERAQAFADKWGFQKAYGSYDELVNDDAVDLVYVATPHSHHFDHAKLCVEHGKAVLCEKAFTANAKMAEELLALAETNKIFITEAVWTRYIPARHIVRAIIESGEIGEVSSMYAEFSELLVQNQRMYDPALAGGALLDLGIYAITFASMYFGDNFSKVESSCEKYETGVDATNDIYFTYPDGKRAHLHSSFVKGSVNEGTIYGTKGSIYVDTLMNYSRICVNDLDGNLVKEYPIPAQINGYEYEVLACIDALDKGLLECEQMPHAETIKIMKWMDEIRYGWGIRYPFE